MRQVRKKLNPERRRAGGGRAALATSMHPAGARRRQLYPGQLRARCKEGDELRQRGPTRTRRKVAFDFCPRGGERQQSSGNAADQMDDVKAVSRLDRRADRADLQVDKRTL